VKKITPPFRARNNYFAHGFEGEGFKKSLIRQFSQRSWKQLQLDVSWECSHLKAHSSWMSKKTLTWLAVDAAYQLGARAPSVATEVPPYGLCM
jgi:hypothetical protein